MPLTPHKLMVVLRWAAIAAGLATTAALVGPFRYEQLGLPFPDTVAHAVLFYGLTMLLMSALPRSRTTDLVLVLMALGVASEVVQGLVGREVSLNDFTGDVIGVGLAVAPTYLGRFRTLARTHPHTPFAELRRLDRRQGGRRASAAPKAAEG